MSYIDSHLHTHLVSAMDLEKAAIAGLEVAVIPTPHHLSGISSAETVMQLWRRLLDFEVKRAKSIGIEAYVALSVPFYGVAAEAVKECLEQLPKYLKHERVVGVGEIGLDAGIEDETKLFRAQLKLAKDHNLPIIVHTPVRLAPQAPAVIRQIVKVIKEENFSLDRVILDHVSENTVDPALKSGAMVGLSVCFDKMPPEMAAEIVLKNPDKRDKLLVNDELAWGKDGYFSVPRVMMAMRILGLKREEIEQVTFENQKKFFNLRIG